MSNNALRDLGKLSWHIGVLLVLCSSAAILVWWSFNSQEASRRENSAAESRFQQAAARLRKVGVEEQEIKDKSSLLVKLSQSGIVGDERRLEWIELLQRLRNELRLPELSYEFAPQYPLDTSTVNGYGFYSSPLKVHLRLLHEGDLVSFLVMVQRDARALVVIRECKAARASAGDGGLSADCEFEWITARAAVKAQ